MSGPLVLYHGGCTDGWCAAYILHKCFQQVQAVPCFYGEEPPCVDNRSVIMVDFSYKREVIEKMHADATSLIVLDHHVSARSELIGLPYCVFDELESGATMAIRFAEKRGLWFGLDSSTQAGLVELAKFVKDRDLWQWKVTDSREMNTAIRSYPMTVEAWDKLAYRITRDPKSLVNEGVAISRYQQSVIDSHIRHAYEMELFGYKVPVVECTFGDLVSEMLCELANGKPFAAGWFKLGDKVVVSLRSDPDGMDVSQLAVSVGGGGHVRAAGFRIDASLWLSGEVDG